MSSPSDAKIDAFCDGARERYVDELKALVAIASISADPERRGDVRRCAEALVQRMSALGLTAEILETKGNPIAYGQWLGAPGKPTVIVYGHYDVQPVDPLDLWLSPPFEAAVRDGKISTDAARWTIKARCSCISPRSKRT